MADAPEQARAYVEDLRRRGYPDPEIAHLLREAGWRDDQVAALVGLPPPPLPVPPLAPVPAPVSPAEGGSGLATTALVLGLISIFLVPLALVTGPFAVIFGAISLSKRRPGSGMAITGIILATVSWLLMLIVGPILAAILFPVFFRAREKAQDTSCLSNVKQLALAVQMYTVDYDNLTPPADRWPELANPYVQNLQLYLCPSDERPAKQSQGGHDTSYTMSEAAGGISLASVPQPEGMGMLFDGKQVSGDRGAADFRHLSGLNVAYADGHCRWQARGAFESLLLSPAESTASPPAEPVPSGHGYPDD